jgi:hypothetical protein
LLNNWGIVRCLRVAGFKNRQTVEVFERQLSYAPHMKKILPCATRDLKCLICICKSQYKCMYFHHRWREVGVAIMGEEYTRHSNIAEECNSTRNRQHRQSCQGHRPISSWLPTPHSRTCGNYCTWLKFVINLLLNGV